MIPVGPTRSCPYCGSRVIGYRTHCPTCESYLGRPNAGAVAKDWRAWLVILLIAGGALVAILLGFR